MANLARIIFGTIIALFSVLYLAGCGGGETPDDMVELRGLVTFREKVSLPATARLEVELRDVTKADAAAEILGRTVVENAGQIPIGYVITFNATKFEQGHIYAVNAAIMDGSRILFTTDKVHPADLENLTGLLEIVLIKVN